MSVANGSTLPTTVDWNLFLVLHTVLEEGSVTKAAKRLHVTQSAVSNALGRLRAVLDDQLVVRIGNELHPTPKARALAPRIRLVVAELNEVMHPTRAFDSASSTRRFVLALSDDVELSLLGPLLDHMKEELPHASLRSTFMSSSDAAKGLGSGEIDAVVGMIEAVPAGSAAEELFEDELAVVVRKGHAWAGKTVKQNELAEATRVVVESQLDTASIIDRALLERNLNLRVSSVVACFASAAAVLIRSDSVLIAPHRVALSLTQSPELRALGLRPIGSLLSVSLVWHARADADTGSMRFRELLRKAARA